MPPKKQRKLDQIGLSETVSKSKDNRTKRQTKSKTKSVKANDKTSVIEAAEGAGIRTTAELQAYTRETRSKARSKLTIADEQLGVDSTTTSVTPQITSASIPDDTGSMSSSSSADDDSSDSEVSVNQDDPPRDDPVRRKLPFNRQTGEFMPVEVSPGSLQDCKDVRDLGKLQDMLLTNPQAVNAIASMIDVIKAMQTDKASEAPLNRDPQGQPMKTKRGQWRGGCYRHLPLVQWTIGQVCLRPLFILMPSLLQAHRNRYNTIWDCEWTTWQCPQELKIRRSALNSRNFLWKPIMFIIFKLMNSLI